MPTSPTANTVARIPAHDGVRGSTPLATSTRPTSETTETSACASPAAVPGPVAARGDLVILRTTSASSEPASSW